MDMCSATFDNSHDDFTDTDMQNVLCDDGTASCDFVVYTVGNVRNKCTYVGVTNNLTRRLRQHNGFITGGAKYTRGKGPWHVCWVVTGFQQKSHALMFEWAVKRAACKQLGSCCGTVAMAIRRRRAALATLLTREAWTKRSPRAATIRLAILVNDDAFPREFVAEFGRFIRAAQTVTGTQCVVSSCVQGDLVVLCHTFIINGSPTGHVATATNPATLDGLRLVT